MTPLERLTRKKERLAVGLMSGTSVDTVDAVLVKIRGSGLSTRFRQIAFHSLRYPNGFREFVLRNSLPGKGSVDIISTLNILVANFFADAVKAVSKKAHIPLDKIDLIGSHGQTIHHLPHSSNLFGKNIRSTLQIGDPSTIAKLTGIITVGDFRTGDMALGGQGAPLVPYFDLLAFSSSKHNRALLNIGGIANITLLKKNCSVNDVIAFDTGPGNMVIDALVKRYYHKEFDLNGEIARRGKILPDLLALLAQHPYFEKKPPKSTGREMFGAMFVQKIVSRSRRKRKEDIIATVTELTAMTVYGQYVRFLRKRLKGDPLSELIISGGGSMNRAMVNALKKYFFPAVVLSSDEFGISSKTKESLCFAILANETISGNTSNIPSVTGAGKGTVLGKICV